MTGLTWRQGVCMVMFVFTMARVGSGLEEGHISLPYHSVQAGKGLESRRAGAVGGGNSGISTKPLVDVPTGCELRKRSLQPKPIEQATRKQLFPRPHLPTHQPHTTRILRAFGVEQDVQGAEDVLVSQGKVEEAIAMRHGLHQYEEALALGRAHRLPEERLEVMAQEYFRLLLDTKQEERAAGLKEKEVCALFVRSSFVRSFVHVILPVLGFSLFELAWTALTICPI